MTWLEWARQLQALAQSGLAYEPTPYHADRYALVRRISAEMIAAGIGGDALPELDPARTPPGLVELCFAHERDRSLPTDFD